MPDATLDASYQAYKSVENAGFVGWIRRSRRIRQYKFTQPEKLQQRI